MFSKIFPAKIILFLYFYMCVFVCFACCRPINLNICYINCQQPYTDCSLFRLLLKTNYNGFLEKMSAIIIIFFSYLSNLFYYLFLYLFIIIFIYLFIYLSIFGTARRGYVVDSFKISTTIFLSLFLLTNLISSET